MAIQTNASERGKKTSMELCIFLALFRSFSLYEQTGLVYIIEMYVGGSANMQIFNEITKFCRQKAYSIFKTGLKKMKKENFISYVCAVGCCFFFLCCCLRLCLRLCVMCVCGFAIVKVPIAYRIRIYFWTIHKALPCLMDEPSKFNWYMNWNMNKTKLKRKCDNFCFGLNFKSGVFAQLCVNICLCFSSQSFWEKEKKKQSMPQYKTTTTKHSDDFFLQLRRKFVQWIGLKSKYASCN